MNPNIGQATTSTGGTRLPRWLAAVSLVIAVALVYWPGRGGGFVSSGRHVIYQRETPIANLFATMVERVGARPEHIGDSTGRLASLSLS